MRALVTTLGVVLTLGIAVGGLPAESGAAQATLGCPGTAQAGQQFTIEVAIDVGTTPLGAYSIAVTYDPAVLTLASVAGGNTAEFSGKPTTNTPTPGTTNLSAFQSVSLTSPTGVVSVALISFSVAATASATTAIGLTVKTLFDTNSTAILPATGTGCSVSVMGAGSTTTSTTSTTIATTTTSTTTLPPSTTTTTRPPTTTSSTSTSTTTSTTTTRPPSTTTSTISTTTTRPPTTTTIPGNLPPDCSAAAASPAALWPPNHQFVDVAIVGVTDPDGDPVAITITGITQDEPLNGGGQGNTCPDATGVGTATASLRAEREGGGDGRVYHISFTADDGRGGRCTTTVTVCVPHDQGQGRVCVDQGPLVDSTGPTCVGACTGGCAIEMAVAQPVCTDENLPAALVQRLDTAQQLITQAAGTSGKKKAKRLMRRGIKVLKQAAGIAAKDAKKGTISPGCAASIATEFGNAKTGADRWLHTR